MASAHRKAGIGAFLQSLGGSIPGVVSGIQDRKEGKEIKELQLRGLKQKLDLGDVNKLRADLELEKEEQMKRDREATKRFMSDPVNAKEIQEEVISQLNLAGPGGATIPGEQPIRSQAEITTQRPPNVQEIAGRMKPMLGSMDPNVRGVAESFQKQAALPGEREAEMEQFQQKTDIGTEAKKEILDITGAQRLEQIDRTAEHALVQIDRRLDAQAALAEKKITEAKKDAKGKGLKDLPARTKNRLTDFASGFRLLKNLVQTYDKSMAGGVSGGIAGATEKIPFVGEKVAPKTANYQNKRKQTAEVFLRAATGAQANDTEVKLYAGFLPEPGDSRRTAEAKFKNFIASVRARSRGATDLFRLTGEDETAAFIEGRMDELFDFEFSLTDKKDAEDEETGLPLDQAKRLKELRSKKAGS